MAKKKSRTVVKKGPPPKVSSVFDCPKCSHSQCVEVKMKRTQMTALLFCRVCKVKANTRINHLMREVQVFCNWKDRMEREEKEKREGRWLGIQADEPEDRAVGRADNSDSEEDEPGPSAQAAVGSKTITKKQKFEINRGSRLHRKDYPGDSSEDESPARRHYSISDKDSDSDDDINLVNRRATAANRKAAVALSEESIEDFTQT